MSILLVIATMAVRFVAVITFLGAAGKPMFSLMEMPTIIYCIVLASHFSLGSLNNNVAK